MTNRTTRRGWRHLVVIAIVAAIVLLLITCQTSTYTMGYVARVMIKQDANADDYRWKNSYPVAASARPVPLPRIEAVPEVAAAFQSHPRVDDLEAYLERTGTRAFLVVRGDALVYERYFNGASPESMQATFSVSKSILSLLIGQAVDRRQIALSEAISARLPELLFRDHRFGNITLADLIDMRSGIAYSDDIRFPIVTNDAPLIYYASDLRRVALEKTRIEARPGDFHYNDYNPNLLALALERATGVNPVEGFGPSLWDPIGAQDPALWSVDDGGFPYWESGLVATARDLAKIGLMMLRGGVGPHGPVISETWHRRSTSYEPKPRREAYDGGQWAYRNGWWRILRPREPHDYAAIGRFGQFIYVSPANAVVIVRTGSEQAPPSDRESTRLFYHAADRLGAASEVAGE